jgi:SAM-dependent methyltransferase
MDRQMLRAYLRRPQSRIEIVREFCRGRSVLDLGCVNHDIENSDSDLWLHKNIRQVASKVVGVDYLAEEVELLRQRGYNVVVGDVTKPLPLDQTFDVIVVGHLIEHLSGFDGLMTNLRRLLAPGGVVLICTPNPFFREQYFYSALKNDILVNQEHTCWIDPVTLDQLCRRFGLETSEIRWIKEKWHLSQTIFQGDCQSFDMFSNRWQYRLPRPILERLIAPLLLLLYKLPLQPERQARVARRYGPQLGSFLYMLFKGKLFEAWWRIRRLVIPTSDINRYEAFMSVIRLIKPVQPTER